MDKFGGSGVSDNMNVVYSGCRKFARRHDFDVFSMSDYTSCENCRHLNGENQCEKKLEEGRYDL
ncbi:MAG: hypothetical protein IKM63_01355 [Firmicutes bacterium]|nr:hypothetical protein [Bacillota bacterium]MBR6798694.1 hypothetical protein [Bacillota bacterium]